MATHQEAVYSSLHNVVRSEEAVAGEAAGVAMGLVMLGSANQTALYDMLNHAHRTEHEKIIRGLAIGCAKDSPKPPPPPPPPFAKWRIPTTVTAKFELRFSSSKGI